MARRIAFTQSFVRTVGIGGSSTSYPIEAIGLSGHVEITLEPVSSPRPLASGRASPGCGLVHRHRLWRRLSRAAVDGVVLVAAPAGSGKSVLVRTWLDAKGVGDRTAWVSVERGESDGQRFWLAVTDELARVLGDDHVVKPIGPAPRLRTGAIVERLIDDLDAVDKPVVLVLDDLHELRSTDALRSLRTLLEHHRTSLSVVLVTREEPHQPELGLHRLRVASRLTEIRAADLRFSVDETRDLLAGSGITLSDGAVASLQARTEGWAAGLRLAAISLARHPDPERFVGEFSGSERTIAEYLFAEVLDRQPPEVRDMLLRTSVLERVSGSLADALTGRVGSERMLQRLESENAFVTALDAGRSWFRYHHLFADLLRLELRRSAPTIIGSLHRAAARWHERHGDVVEAVRHGQAAGDWDYACRVLAEHIIDLTLDGRLATVHTLLDAFPADMRATDPELTIVFASASISSGVFDEARVYVDHAQRLAATVPAERRRWFDLTLASLRLWLASCRGDLGTAREDMRALEAVLAAPRPEELAFDNDLYASALLNLGTAELWSFRLDDARRSLERALALARRIPRPYLEISCCAHLCIAAIGSGAPPGLGIEHSGHAVALAEAHGWGDDPVVGAPWLGRAAASVWLGRFEEADRSLARARATLGADRELGLAFLLHYVQGLLSLALGRLEDAMASFTAAERTQTLLATEHTMAVDMRGRLVQTLVRLGDTAAARRRLADINPQLRDRTIIRVAEAGVLLAEGSPEAAVEILAPALRRADEPIHASWGRIEALLYDAVARERLGHPGDAKASIDPRARAGRAGPHHPALRAAAGPGAPAEPSAPHRRARAARGDPGGPRRIVTAILR